MSWLYAYQTGLVKFVLLSYTLKIKLSTQSIHLMGPKGYDTYTFNSSAQGAETSGFL